MSATSVRNALIIVDMSVEQVSDVTYNVDRVIENIQRLASAGGGAFDLIVDSRLWLTDPSDSSLAWVWEGTAKTLFVADSEGASLIPQLRNLNLPTKLQFVKKYNYSCLAGEECQLRQLLRSREITHVYICGINTDYCVFATALDAFQQNYRPVVVKDAVTSVRGKAAHDEGLRNVERHFGSQALLTTKQVLERLGESK